MAERIDPFPQFNFLVEIGDNNRIQAGFMECSGLTTDTDAIDYREGTDPMHVRKLTGLRKYTNITLKRGYTQNMDLWLWRKSIIDMPTRKLDRRNVTITLKSEDRTPVMSWVIEKAWISKWDSGPFNAKTNDVAIETIELIHEGIRLDETLVTPTG